MSAPMMVENLSVTVVEPTFSHSDTRVWADYVQENLFLQETWSDTALVIGDEKIPAHKVILSQSPVFLAMFSAGMRESHEDEIMFNAFPPRTMRLLLRYLYLGAVEAVPLEDMVPLMACADHFGMTQLRDALNSWLVEHVSIDNVCVVLSDAQTYHQQSLVDAGMSYMRKNLQMLVHADTFLRISGATLEDLLTGTEGAVGTRELDVFRAVLRWLQSPCNEEAQAKDPGLAMRLLGCIQHGREPFLGGVTVSDAQYLKVQGSSVTKIKRSFWNCTAMWVPTTNRVRVIVHRLVKKEQGVKFGLCHSEAQNPTAESFLSNSDVSVFPMGYERSATFCVDWEQGSFVEVTWHTMSCGQLHVYVVSCAPGSVPH
eukprot:247435-Amphidinium_carterae.1